MIKPYISLTKPGIIRGNLMTTAAGFLLASEDRIDLELLVATLTGITLVIASACVFNNYIDRDIDKKMARTKTRALVSGVVSGRNALIYATVLGLAGGGLLAMTTNLITLVLGIVAFFSYVVLYGVAKRRSVHGTLVGTISGAIPPVAGYVAVTNQLDLAAGLLFLIMVCWQMPHFYAIAMYRFKDYKAAGLPVLPVKKGLPITKLQIRLYIVAFIVATQLLVVFGYTGYSYGAVMLLLGLAWLGRALQASKANDDTIWAKQLFLFSLLVITVWCLMLALEAVLP